MADNTRPLPPHIETEVQRILDSEARRILDERQAVLDVLVVTYWKGGRRIDA